MNADELMALAEQYARASASVDGNNGQDEWNACVAARIALREAIDYALHESYQEGRADESEAHETGPM